MPHLVLLSIPKDPRPPVVPSGSGRTWFDGSQVDWFDGADAFWLGVTQSPGLDRTWYDGSQSNWYDGSRQLWIGEVVSLHYVFYANGSLAQFADGSIWEFAH